MFTIQLPSVRLLFFSYVFLKYHDVLFYMTHLCVFLLCPSRVSTHFTLAQTMYDSKLMIVFESVAASHIIVFNCYCLKINNTREN